MTESIYNDLLLRPLIASAYSLEALYIPYLYHIHLSL